MIRRLLAATAMIGALILPRIASAQGPSAPGAEATAPADGEGSSGSPIYGYLAFGALAGLTLAIVCRSSRRS